MFHVIPDAYFKPPVAKQPDGSDVVSGNDVVKLAEGDQPPLDEQGPVDEEIASMLVNLIGAEEPDAPRSRKKPVRDHAHHRPRLPVH